MPEIDFYSSPSGDEPVDEFLDSLPRKARQKCLAFIDRFREQGFSLPSGWVRKVASDVWELRPEWNGIEYRLLLGQIAPGKFRIVMAGQKETSQAAFQNDIQTARRRLQESDQ